MARWSHDGSDRTSGGMVGAFVNEDHQLRLSEVISGLDRRVFLGSGIGSGCDLYATCTQKAKTRTMEVRAFFVELRGLEPLTF